jgi:hypothetical protein
VLRSREAGLAGNRLPKQRLVGWYALPVYIYPRLCEIRLIIAEKQHIPSLEPFRHCIAITATS